MYYVIHGRKTLLVLVAVFLIGLALWNCFPTALPHRQPTDPSGDNQNQPGLDVEPAVQTLAGGIQRNVSELDENFTVSVESVPTKFAEYRIEREKVRSCRLELLEQALTDPKLADDHRQEVHHELLDLLEAAAAETEIETLLKASGYLDAVTLIENASATVVVPVTLSQKEAVAIGDIVHRITGIRLERITIVDELART